MLTTCSASSISSRASGRGTWKCDRLNLSFPVVSVGFRGGFAVIHCASAPDEMALLYGDGSVAPEEAIELPIMDELATFTGEFVLNAAGARKALRDFVVSGTPASLGEWYEL
jgi:hypothetical protein